MTSEEGGTINDPAALSRELAWILLNGQGHHNYYYSAVDYMRLEQETGWFSRNSRLFELVGKATWKKPPVAVLRAARSDLYFPYNVSVHARDVGAGPEHMGGVIAKDNESMPVRRSWDRCTNGHSSEHGIAFAPVGNRMIANDCIQS